MLRCWRVVVLGLGLCVAQSGCAIYRPYEVVRIWGDWNTERQCNFQVTHYTHLPLRPVRVRLAAWAYNPGTPGTPVPPRSGSPSTTVVPADALPPPPPAPPTEDPSGLGIPQTRPTPAPPLPSPPPPAAGTSQDLLELARPPRMPSSPALPRGADVLPNRPGAVPLRDETGELGPTAQTASPVMPSVYETLSSPGPVPRPEPPKNRSAAWLFQQ